MIDEQVMVRLPYVAPGRRRAEWGLRDKISSGVSLLRAMAGATMALLIAAVLTDKPPPAEVDCADAEADI